MALVLFSNAVPGVPAYQVSWPELRTTLHESANLFYIVRCQKLPQWKWLRARLPAWIHSVHALNTAYDILARRCVCRMYLWTAWALRLCRQFQSTRSTRRCSMSPSLGA